MLESSDAQLDSRQQRRQFVVMAALIVFLALAIRVVYVVGAKVDYPIRGDVNQYVLYAWNLTHRGVFSTSLPDADVAVPDSFRGPGYPAMLALTMAAAGHSDLPLREGPNGQMALGYVTDTWMQFALAMQAILGAATVWLTILIARFWLGRGWALSAGMLVALWPHMISFSGALLSETLFGFMLVLSIWLTCRAEHRGSSRTMALAGLAFGLTYLVNPIVLLFVPMAALFLAVRSRKILALALLAPFVIAPAAWAVRNSVNVTGASALERMEVAFVEGSWPQCHAALNSRFNNAISQQIVDAINQEVRVMQASWSVGFAGVVDRMRQDPAFYASWYMLEKPFSLWDWKIHIGAGDIYFLPTDHSPFERIAVLAFAQQAYQRFNPVLFALASVNALWWLFAMLFRPREVAFAPTLIAGFALYVTAVHTVLDAEPRYSIPYRPHEVLLAITSIAWLANALIHRLRKSSVAPAAQRN